ncbi:hypothetical protein BGX26_008520 [Mortierella sp. AD094]|nr:hypothetical protein BGX26_008520 [Mortierella sp. AD094]
MVDEVIAVDFEQKGLVALSYHGTDPESLLIPAEVDEVEELEEGAEVEAGDVEEEEEEEEEGLRVNMMGTVWSLLLMIKREEGRTGDDHALSDSLSRR